MWRGVTEGVDACGSVGAAGSGAALPRDCHRWTCWSPQWRVREPRCWQLFRDSAETGSPWHPCWLDRQMRPSWWRRCSLSSRRSGPERRTKKTGFPGSPHQPLRKTQGGSMRTAGWWAGEGVLGAVMPGGEGLRTVAAALRLRQPRGCSLNSCLWPSPCMNTGTGRIPPVWWWWPAGWGRSVGPSFLKTESPASSMSSNTDDGPLHLYGHIYNSQAKHTWSLCSTLQLGSFL